jgi:hypothetical protein
MLVVVGPRQEHGRNLGLVLGADGMHLPWWVVLKHTEQKQATMPNPFTAVQHYSILQTSGIDHLHVSNHLL